MNVFAGSRGRGDRTLPGRLHSRFRAGRANGFDAGQGFDQDAVPRGGFRLQSLHRAVERTLQDEARGQIMIGSMVSGIQASGPAMRKRTPMKMIGEQRDRSRQRPFPR